MPEEGMVDALRRAAGLLAPDGVLLDLHPTSDFPQLTVVHHIDHGGREEPIGPLISEAARKRHAAADRAIEAALAEQTLVRDAAAVFVFSHYSDSADELADHVNAKWTTHFSDDLREHARRMLRPQS